MPKPSKNRGNNTLPGLEPELARLKRRFQSGQILELEWSPNNVPTSGEVTGGTIRIYEEDEARHKC